MKHLYLLTLPSISLTSSRAATTPLPIILTFIIISITKRRHLESKNALTTSVASPTLAEPVPETSPQSHWPALGVSYLRRY
mmetsp:Transcript_14898/g.26319  ORF Transcript_14898/g.26319 Transcript_14898/m.26319 type:complete len:81 (+) Transcript_14898:832-1074(+)